MNFKVLADSDNPSLLFSPKTPCRSKDGSVSAVYPRAKFWRGDLLRFFVEKLASVFLAGGVI